VSELRVRPVRGLPRLGAGDDLAGLLAAALAGAPPGDELADGDVVCVSSKAVAKTEGRVVAVGREVVAQEETVRVVARRGPLRVARTRHGLVLAAAGVDVSNTEPGTVVPLPVDPDASARRLRAELGHRTGRRVAVVVTDTAGRAWREGQTDLAVGCAGLAPLMDLAGQTDAYGTVLEVTAPAIADEVAAAADLVTAKDAMTPAAVISGLGSLVLPADEHGPGAVALSRAEAHDLFGLGTGDAVLAAVRRAEPDRAGFAVDPRDFGVRVAELARVASAPFGDELRITSDPSTGTVRAQGDPVAAGALGERLRVLGWAVGCAVRTLRRPEPGDTAAWRLIDSP
jgi:coenzyme F420-0:L-glutamate ligase/coenzyme F420-1:gamma-L-glutamate ligase